MEMTANERDRWIAHLTTPVIFNHHEPIVVNSSSIKKIDLNPIESTRQALQRQEHVLLLTPLRDASFYIPTFAGLLANLTYPHNLIDLAFLVGDTRDDTVAVLAAELDRIQSRSDSIAFRSVTIIEKDLHVTVSQQVDDRHGFAAQAPRRKAMGRARNYLLSTALKPEHSWVFWWDADVVESPPSILQDLMAHDRDIIVPNIWFHRYQKNDKGETVDIEGRFDYNLWKETTKSKKLLKKLSSPDQRDIVLAEGYQNAGGYDTGREYMCRMGDRHANKDEEIELDGIGGVNILVKADVHRSGINFPAYAFENQAETEGFAKMAKRAGYGVYGLPNYVVWHIDTDEKPGNA